MSGLCLVEWKNDLKVPLTHPDYDMAVHPGEKVFAYGQGDLTKLQDAANISFVLKAFGYAKIQSVNKLSQNHAEAVDLKPNLKNIKSINLQRIEAIDDIDQTFAKFFLEKLHFMMWKNYKDGIQSKIVFDEAYEMLKKITGPLYQLLLASVHDKFSKDLSMAEMKSIMDVHNLNNDFSLGRNMKKPRATKKKE